MKRASWLALALALGLLMPLVGAPAGGMAQRVSPASRPAAVQSVVLDPIMDIWLDGLQNFAPAVAYNSRDDEYLVVWYTQQGTNTEDIWARRVGSDGSLRSSFNVVTGEAEKRWQPVVACSPAQSQEQPAVACDPAGDCLVVWADSRAAGGGAGDYEIRGRFVRLRHTYLPAVLRDQG